MSSAGTRSLFVAAEAFLSLAGAGIAGTLWWADQTRRDVPCSAGGGCAIVNASSWSHVDLIAVHHVPVALLGLIGYVLLFTFAMLRLSLESIQWDRRLHGVILLFSAGGASYSWFLQWIAHAEIGAFCIWCRTSAIVMSLLLCIAAAEWGLKRRQHPKPQKTASSETASSETASSETASSETQRQEIHG